MTIEWTHKESWDAWIAETCEYSSLVQYNTEYDDYFAEILESGAVLDSKRFHDAGEARAFAERTMLSEHADFCRLCGNEA